MANRRKWRYEHQTIDLLTAIQPAIVLIALSVPDFPAEIVGEADSDGSFKNWHHIKAIFAGPLADESPATFSNYRLDVTSTSPSGKQ